MCVVMAQWIRRLPTVTCVRAGDYEFDSLTQGEQISLTTLFATFLNRRRNSAFDKSTRDQIGPTSTEIEAKPHASPHEFLKWIDFFFVTQKCRAELPRGRGPRRESAAGPRCTSLHERGILRMSRNAVDRLSMVSVGWCGTMVGECPPRVMSGLCSVAPDRSVHPKLATLWMHVSGSQGLLSAATPRQRPPLSPLGPTLI